MARFIIDTQLYGGIDAESIYRVIQFLERGD